MALRCNGIHYMEEWKVIELREITELVIDYRGKTPLKLGHDWCDHGYRALSAKNIKTGRLVNEEDIRYVDEELYHLWMKEEVKRGDILITSEAPFGEVFFWDSDEKIVLSQRLFDVRLSSSVDHRYVYYYMTTRSFQGELDGRSSGTTVVGLRQPELLKCRIALPELESQRKIASILKAIDDKINCNTRINRLLEEIAIFYVKKRVFQQANNNSRKTSLASVCTKITDGSHFSPKEEPGSVIPMLSVKDMERFGFNYDSCKHISEQDYQLMVANDCVPLKGDVLIAKDGSYLKEIFINKTFREQAVLSSIAIFRPNTSIISPELLLYILKQPEIIQRVKDNYVSGSAVPRIVLKDFKKLEFCLPDIDEQKHIQQFLLSISTKIENTLQENRALVLVRDTLLPKLMSGEIAV